MPLSKFTADDLPAFKRAITQHSHDAMDDIDMIFDIETRGDGVSKESRFTKMVRHFRSLTDTDAALLKAVNAVYTSRQPIGAWRQWEELRQLESTVFKRVGVTHVEGKGYQFVTEMKVPSSPTPTPAPAAKGPVPSPSAAREASKTLKNAALFAARQDHEGWSAWEQEEAEHTTSLRRDAERQEAEERAELGSVAEWERQASEDTEHARREAERQDVEERESVAEWEREAVVDAEDAYRESQAREWRNDSTQSNSDKEKRSRIASQNGHQLADAQSEVVKGKQVWPTQVRAQKKPDLSARDTRDEKAPGATSPGASPKPEVPAELDRFGFASEDTATSSVPGPTDPEEKKRVFIVQGRDIRPVQELERFIAFLQLGILTFQEAKRLTGKPTPATFDIVLTALQHAGAIIVLLSPDEEASLRPQLGRPEGGFQPRQNVLLEAGLAYGLAPDRTIFVRTDTPMRPISDIVGLHFITMDGSEAQREALFDALDGIGMGPNPMRRSLSDHLAGKFQVPDL